MMRSFADLLNHSLWGYLLPVSLISVGAWFTWRFRLLQLWALPHSIRLMFRGSGSVGITPFQAFSTGLASRVGTGNIVGVAIALTAGGPGAIFWMWLTALLGMASAFVEATLAQIFKVRAADGSFRGGPAYYIQLGLGSRSLGMVFAIALVCAFGFAFNAVQSHTIADALSSAFGWSRVLIGIGVVLLAAPAIFGGVRRITRIAQIVVPLLATFYLLITLYMVIKHIDAVPGMFSLIFRSAFGLEQAVGGFVGHAVSQAMMVGVRRGLFSNEAGMGSAPNAAAMATTGHPVNQGLLQMLGVFVDTIVICSATAFIILLSGVYQVGTPLQGATLAQAAVFSEFGIGGRWFLSIMLAMLAFSAVLGNYVYAESNVQFISRRPNITLLLRLSVLAMIYVGCTSNLESVWAMADKVMGVMALINLTAILLLGKYAVGAWQDYQRQKNLGVLLPQFEQKILPELAERLPKESW